MGVYIMKQHIDTTRRAVIISILIILLSLGMAGAVAAADPQMANSNGWGNMTSPSAYHQNAYANSSMWNHVPAMMGHQHMMMRYGHSRGMQRTYPGMRSGAGAMGGSGIIHAGFMFFGVILTYLLMIVWLIVGILVIILLLRKLQKDKIP